MHWVVESGTPARASMGQPTVLLLQELDSWHLLLSLAPGTLPIPDPSKLLNPVHLHMTIVQAFSSVREVLCIGMLASVSGGVVGIGKRRANTAITIAVRGRPIGWGVVKVGCHVEVRGEVGVREKVNGRVKQGAVCPLRRSCQAPVAVELRRLQPGCGHACITRVQSPPLACNVVRMLCMLRIFAAVHRQLV